MKQKRISTYDQLMKDADFKEEFEQEYNKFAFSELMRALTSDEDPKSVRKMAEEVGLHPNTIQNLKSGKTKDIKFKSLNAIVEAFGFHIEFVKDETRLSVSKFFTSIKQSDTADQYDVVKPC